MRIIYLKKLLDYSKKHAETRTYIASWKKIVENANWKMKTDILKDFPHAKVLKGNRARFEIKHNTYRLIAHVNYEISTVEIRFIGTHNEYDKINPVTI